MARSNVSKKQIRRPYNKTDNLALYTKFAEHDTALDSLEAFTGGTTDYKASCRFATTADITLASAGLTAVDGVTPVAGNRALVKNQGTASQNGIYIVGATAWTRATDFDASAEVTSGARVFVSEGTANGGKWFSLTTADPITLASTSLTFTQEPNASELASTANAKGASLVGVEDATPGYFTGATVEAVLREIWTKLILTTTPGGASYVGVFDTATHFTAANVEAALAEIMARAKATDATALADVQGIRDVAGLLAGATVEAALANLAGGNGAIALAPVRRVRGVETTNMAAFTGVSTTFDGLTLVEGDRILCVGQTSHAEDGIYVVGVVGGGTADWTRSSDWSAAAVIPNGTLVVVDAGTAGANTVYKTTNAGAITVATTVMTWERLHTSTELASTAASKGASLLGVQDADALITAANAEAALKEIASGGLADTSPVHIVAGMTTGNIAALATFTVNNDGVTHAAGARILVRAQTAEEENGIYVVGAVDAGTAPLTRAKDWDANAEIKPNTLVAVTGGTLGATTLWQLTGDFPTNLGTSHAHFTQVYNATQTTAAAITIAKKTVTINDEDAAMTGSPVAYNIGTALPANAIVLAHEINVVEQLVGLADVTIKIGGTVTDAIVAASTDLDGMAIGKYSGTLGVHPQGSFSSEQLTATITSAAGDLVNLSAGQVIITVWYSVLA